MSRIFLDSFSGPASNLKGDDRTPESVLNCLRTNPRVSCWDMEEHQWLRSAIKALEKSGKIKEMNEPYPWLRFAVITKEAAND